MSQGADSDEEQERREETYRRWVEDDVAVRLGELRELGALVVRLGGARAVCPKRREAYKESVVSSSFVIHDGLQENRRDAQWLATRRAGLEATELGL